jgi:hypothetical protein
VTKSGNTALGYRALTQATGANNIALGTSAGSLNKAGIFNIDIGHLGKGTDTRTIRIGTTGDQTAAYLAGVFGASVPGPTQAVVVNADGKLGTTTVAATRQVAKLRAQVRRQDQRIAALEEAVRSAR